MALTQTIKLVRPVVAACIIDAAQLRIAEGELRINATDGNPPSAIRNPPSDALQKEMEQKNDELARLLTEVRSIAAGLRQLQEQTLANNRGEIAKLAVEIARKILRSKVSQGDYEIQAIVEEALKQAPTRQNVVVRLHPEDLPGCQQLQRDNPQGPFAELEFTADWSIGRGECLVETPKGIIRSFLDEHLDRISDAMQRVE